MPAFRACLGLVVAVLLAAPGCDSESASAGRDAPLARCDSLSSDKLGPIESDPSWRGCLTSDGAALQSYQFICSGLGGGLTSSRTDTPIVFIPDAGLVGAEGQEWLVHEQLAAYHRTPFEMLGSDGCDELRSIPQDWPIRVTCDLDGIPIDFVTLQGCERDGEYHAAVGRPCTFFDFDINAVWEQWWIDAPTEDYGDGAFVLETDGQTQLWRITPDSHRDDRCATPPNEWPDDWRYDG